MAEILAQVQRQYADEGKKAAQDAVPRQHSADVVKIKPPDESREAKPLIGPAMRSCCRARPIDRSLQGAPSSERVPDGGRCSDARRRDARNAATDAATLA